MVLGILRFVFYPGLFSESNFVNWDAEHYSFIKEKGYEGFRVAFFPFFPMLWRFSTLGVHGILFLNAFIYIGAFYCLMKSMRLKFYETVLYLSIPSSIFYFLPYSEAVFFVSATVLLLGVKKQKIFLVLVGLFLCTLARPSFTILIPALFIMEFLGNENRKQIVTNCLLYCAVSALGIGVVGWIQYQQTGEWFQFFAVQKGWGNYLQMPQFPLRSWGGNMIVRLDGVALFFGVMTGIVLVLFLVRSQRVQLIHLPKEVILSLAYVAGITASVFLFRGGSLFSLNRFVFAVPFIMIAVNYYLNSEFCFSNKQLGIALFILVLYWLSFASYVHIQAFLKFLAASLYVVLVFGLKSNSSIIQKISIYALILVNFIFLIIFYIHFLTTEGEVGFVG